MIKNILSEEIEVIRKNIDTFPNIKDIFSEDFINNLLKIEERLKKHSLFWILLDLQKTSKLSNNLGILRLKFSSFSSLLNRLLDDIDKDNFYSVLTEIEILSYFYDKFSSENLEYEPSIEGKTGKPDLKLNLNGEEYYMEIFNLRDDSIQREINEIQDSIKKEIDKINQPFSILFSTEISFKKENMGDFVSFVSSLLDKKEQIKHGDKFDFFKDNSKLADIKFFNSNNNQGQVYSMLHPLRILNDSIRIKNKMLDKIDKQLPEDKKSIIIMDNSYAFYADYDVFDAIYGRYCVFVDPNTREIKDARQPNGLIHHPKGKSISAIVSYSGDYSNRKIFLNPFATNKLSEQELSLFIPLEKENGS